VTNGKRFEPQMKKSEREQLYEGWQAAVARAELKGFIRMRSRATEQKPKGGSCQRKPPFGFLFNLTLPD
jgi:hypothetical protein